MSESESSQKPSLPSNPFIRNNSATIISSDDIQLRRRMVRNYSLLWLDECMDQTNKDYENSMIQIQTIADNVNVFNQRDECIDFLSDAQDIKFFLIVKDTMSQQIMPLINDIPQLDSVYIFSNIKSCHEKLTKKWRKIKSAHSNIDDLCQGLQLGIKQYHQDSIAMSFITTNDMKSAGNLNQLEPTFMYTQLFKEILLNMKHGKQAIKEFTTYCRQNNTGSPANIDQFENDYHTQSAIWWYTFPSFIYSMLNGGLRFMEGDTLIKMGFFMHDLHLQIKELHQQQSNTDHSKPFTVYRGQGLSKANFEKLQKTKGSLMSFNNFLSTSTGQDTPLGFALSALENADTVGILFEISINPRVKSVPFAFIKEKSYFDEEDEILFSMHTVFRVGAIKVMDINNQLYQVELKLTSDDDQQLRLLTDRIREEAGGDTGWYRLGILLFKIGQLNKAEELYNVLLEHSSDESEKAICYLNLAYAKNKQGDYEKAISFYKQGQEIQQKNLPSNHPSLATSYNNIGNVYENMGDYSKALLFYEQGLENRQKTLSLNYPDLATSYNNIGGVYNSMGQYSQALSYYDQGLQIYQKHIPSNHPSLATSYSNIGNVYDNNGEYSKALSYYEKALEIQQKTVPSNHPDLATSYNNIGSVYDNMGQNSKALSSHEKALEIFEKTLPLHHPSLATSYNNIGTLEIREKTLPSNHPSLATSYNNIGNVYENTGDYSKALSYYEKTVEIFEKPLLSNHPSLATSYSNIGSVYEKMGAHLKALSFYKQALEIREKTLPSNHPDLATSYNNIGCVYTKMEEYSKAVSYFEKAREIQEKTVPSNHPTLATSYSNIGSVCENMGEYSKALLYYEKALEIQQKNLPSNHLDLANSYNNIGNVYDKMGEYSKALSSHEKTIKICQKALPSNHSLLATLYANVGLVYHKAEEYSKALLYFEKGFEIQQETRPSNHPDFATSYNNIGSVYERMGKYSKALSYYEKVIEIYQNTLPTNHPGLAQSYNNIGLMYYNMKDYSEALSYYERAMDICQRTLSPTYPLIKSVKESIEVVKKILQRIDDK
ncbi:unnamed protein product [Adineta steineri]|uniref:Uncharacterized protein n=1 Tax=Adineta steineri TaxID=433720 RepID=A0A815Q0Q7_9BILA|nr:unnamed protein product [Adineta steineri]CAF1455885.1 unnamed protein product [Adineta steineri]